MMRSTRAWVDQLSFEGSRVYWTMRALIGREECMSYARRSESKHWCAMHARHAREWNRLAIESIRELSAMRAVRAQQQEVQS